MSREDRKVLTLVVSYNANAWIELCLKSVLASSMATDILVIDNASIDDTCEIIQTHFPDVLLKKNEINLGFGRANNIGLKYALENAYNYVLLINQDVQVSPEMLKRLVERAEEMPEFAVLSPIHLNGKRDNFDSRFFNYLVSGCSPYITDIILKKAYYPVYGCGFVNAAVWLMTKQCITTVGGFDPLFFHTGEDVDYCSRILRKGLKIGICPEIYAYHDRDNSKQSPYHNYYTYKKNNTLLNLKRTHPDSIVKSAIQIFLNSFHQLFHGNMKQFTADLKIAFLIMKNYKQIKISRKAWIEDKAYL